MCGGHLQRRPAASPEESGSIRILPCRVHIAALPLCERKKARRSGWAILQKFFQKKPKKSRLTQVLKNHWAAPIIGIIFLLAIFLRAGIPNMDRKIVAGYEETYHFSALNLLHNHTFTRDVTGAMLHGTVEMTPTANLSPGFPIYRSDIQNVRGSTRRCRPRN